MRISDWSSDVCSSDRAGGDQPGRVGLAAVRGVEVGDRGRVDGFAVELGELVFEPFAALGDVAGPDFARPAEGVALAQQGGPRSGERRGGKECVSTGRERWRPYQ